MKNLGPQMTTDEAIKLLQIHERARQGRLRAKFMWELSREEERRLKGAKGSSHLTEKDAAIIGTCSIFNANFNATGEK